MRQIRKTKGKRLLGAILVLGLLLSYTMVPNVQAKAESMIIALSAKSVKIGDTLTVTVTLPAGATGTVNLTYSKDIFTYQSASAESSVNAGTVSMTLGSFGSGNKRASGTVKFKAEAAGTAGFSASAPSTTNQDGDRVDVGGASVSVAVDNATAAADEKSTDNTLASLTISEGTLSPEFNPGVTEYQAKVGEKITSLVVSAQPNDAKASVISVSGADKLQTGANKVQIVVQAENGVKKTYTIQVNRKEAQKETQAATEQEQTQVSSDGQQYFTIDGTKLYLTDSIPDRYAWDGFVKDTVTLWENTYPCIRKDGVDTPLRLLYLVDENGENGALYLLDLDDPESIYPFVCMNYNQYKHTMGGENTSTELSTQQGNAGLFESTESQMRLILCAFVVVVLILLVILVVLIVKKKKEDTDLDDDLYDDYDAYDEDDEDDLEEDDYDEDTDSEEGISKRYKKDTFRKKGGFMHKLLEGIEDDLDDDIADDLQEDFEDEEKEQKPQEIRQKDPDEDAMLQKELAEEVRSSMLGRKKKTTKKDTDDDIEFIDL